MRQEWLREIVAQAHVSIHAPREGCDTKEVETRDARIVSIHAPREGCDIDLEAITPLCKSFQFTHPGRGATEDSVLVTHGWVVSIHAPREGCDSVVQSCIL